MSVFIILIFLLIFFIYILQKRENFANYECPSSLIKLSGKILAYYNSVGPSHEVKNMIGINPVVFNSLDEYKKYINYQNAKGINCPILNIKHKNEILELENTIKEKTFFSSNLKKAFMIQNNI